MLSFQQKKVLIVAPHMDDEIIGCAGTITLHKPNMSRIAVVFLADDACRMEENKHAADLLGADQLYHLKLRDGFVAQDYEAGVHSLIEIIQIEQPDIVFMPHEKDRHVDHVAAHGIAMDAIEKARYWKTTQPVWKTDYVFEYEVWSFLEEVSEVVDISSVLDRKLTLMKEYESQLDDFDYLMYIRYINGYRGLRHNKKGFAECFNVRRI